MRWRMLFVAAAVAGLTAVVQGQPAAPQAKQKHPYEITPEAGPWAICVTCFFDNFDAADYDPQHPRAGMARSMAIDFVTELRKDYHMFGYMYNRGDEERKKEDERLEAERKARVEMYRKLGVPESDIPKKVWLKRYAHVQDQYVVLIGGFKDQDEARKFLDALRRPEVKPPSEKFRNKMVAGMAPPMGQQGKGYGAYLNPFQTAFVVPNPTVPVQKPKITPEEIAELDPAQFNTHNPYNLLKYPGKWTLVVKAYRVPAKTWGLETKGVVDRGPVDSNTARAFEAIGKQAEQLATVLRTPQLKFDAYVLHTNSYSLVTVGLFDSPNDPRMARLIETLSKVHLDPEALMTPPQPMIVPKSRG